MLVWCIDIQKRRKLLRDKECQRKKQYVQVVVQEGQMGQRYQLQCEMQGDWSSCICLRDSVLFCRGEVSVHDTRHQGKEKWMETISHGASAESELGGLGYVHAKKGAMLNRRSKR